MNIKMKPVCDCGYIFEQLRVGWDGELINVDNKRVLPSIVTLPDKCPICGQWIDSVQFQFPVNGNFDYDVNKYKN